MPDLPERACAFRPFCPETVKPPERYCPEHKPAAEAGDRERRGSANARGYTYRWQKESRAFRFRNPLCRLCEAEGVTRLATLVDHIIPHKGDPVLFWDKKNWQSLCDDCHNEKTAKEGAFGHYDPPEPPQGA